jgi:hypothetical protein
LFWYVVSPPPQNFKEQIGLACCYCCEVLYWLYEYWPTSAWRRVILEFAVRAGTEHTKVHWQKLRGVLCEKLFDSRVLYKRIGPEKNSRRGLFSVKVLLRLDDSEREREKPDAQALHDSNPIVSNF